MVIIGGFGEETLFRGYIFERLTKLLGTSLGAKIVTVLVTAQLFASLHYFDQELAGFQQAIITGVVFRTVFAVTGRTDPDVRTCLLRSDCDRDYLLESRIRSRSPHLQIGRATTWEKPARQRSPEKAPGKERKPRSRSYVR